jgi:hypothetical protein
MIVRRTALLPRLKRFLAGAAIRSVMNDKHPLAGRTARR